MKHPFANIFLFLSFSSSIFAMNISAMNKSEVINALGNKTITTRFATTLNGELIENTLTGYFGKNGQLIGFFTNKPENAPQNDKGRWVVKKDGKICLHWQQWFGGDEHCVFMYKLNNGFITISLNNAFESLILNDDIKTGNQIRSI